MNATSILLCSALVITSTVQAQFQLPPGDLLPGQAYRILFVTETQRDATSTDIADYNAFVAADANASPILAALGTQWFAVASTASVTARANTMTDPSPAGPTGVPIYRPDGTRLAADYDDLWDGTLLAVPNRTSLGNVTSAFRTWTGVVFDGFTNLGNPLGTSTSIAGDPSLATAPWTGANNWVNTAHWPLYGISDVLVVPPPPATVEDLGPGCPYGSKAFRFVPNASGGHDVIDAGSDAFDPVIGPLAGVTSDEYVTATHLDLGFAFPFPSATGVAPEQFVRIDPNGRILPDSSGVTLGTYIPTVSELVSAGYPMVCPFWTDFNVEEPGSGSVHIKTAPGAATFTWYRVSQYGSPATTTPPMTVQCTLFANGEVLVVLEDVQHFNANPSTLQRCIVGISSGAATTVTAPVDLSHVVSGPSASGSPAYEFFTPAEFDLAIEMPTLNAVTTPQLGTSFVFEIAGAPAAANVGLYLIGTDGFAAPIPLSLVGFATPCGLAVSFVDIRVVPPTGAPGIMGAAQITIPATPPSLIGFQLYLQGATDGAPFTTPVLTTNTLLATVGL